MENTFLLVWSCAEQYNGKNDMFLTQINSGNSRVLCCTVLESSQENSTQHTQFGKQIELFIMWCTHITFFVVLFLHVLLAVIFVLFFFFE